MATTIERLKAVVTADTSSAERAFRRVQEEARKTGAVWTDANGRMHGANGQFVSSAGLFGRAAKNAGRSVGGIGRESGAAGKALGGLRSIGSSALAGVGKAAKIAFGAVAVGAGAASVAVGALVGKALTGGWGRLTGIENAEAKLRGLGHSADNVKSIMTDALAAVKGTAFGMDDAATVAATAVAAGVKPGQDLERTLKLIADAATIGGSSMGEMGAIFNKIAAGNKIQAEEANSLIDRGIPVWQLLGKTLGKTQAEVQKMASEGKIDFETFRKAMEGGMGGAALKSGETMTGTLANAIAALSRLGAEVLKGAFPKIKAVVGDAIKSFDGMGPAAKTAGEIVGRALGGGIDLAVKSVQAAKLAFGPALKEIGDAFGRAFSGVNMPKFDFGKSLMDGARIVGPVLADITRKVLELPAAFAQLQQNPAVAGVIGTFQRLWDTAAGVADAYQSKLPGALAALAAPLQALQTQLGPLVERGFGLIKAHVDGLLGAIQALTPGLAEFSSSVLIGLSSVLTPIVDLFGMLAGHVGELAARVQTALMPAVQGLAEIGGTLLGGLGGVVRDLGSAFGSIVTTVTDRLRPAFETVSGAMMPVIDSVGRLLREAIDAVKPKIDELVAAFNTHVRPAIDEARKTIEFLIDKFTGSDGFKFAVEAVAYVLRGLADFIDQVLKPILVAVVKVGFDVIVGSVKAVANVVTVLARLLRGDFSGAWEAVKKTVTDLKGTFDRIGSTLLTGLWEGVKGSINWLRSRMGEFFGGLLPQWVKDMLGIRSPSRVFAELGRFLPMGFADGMLAEADVVRAAAGVLAEAAKPPVGRFDLSSSVTGGWQGWGTESVLPGPDRPALPGPGLSGDTAGQIVVQQTINPAPGMDELLLGEKTALALGRELRLVMTP